MLSHLRLIDFDPNDFSLGEVLGLPEGKRLDSEADFNKALSLVLQWRDEGDNFLYLLKGEDEKYRAVAVDLSFDPDEREVSEIYCTCALEDIKSLRNLVGEKIVLRSEVFHTTYVFSLELKGITKRANKAIFILETSGEMKVERLRRVSRVLVDGINSIQQVPAQLKRENESIPVPIHLVEVSLNSVRVRFVKEFDSVVTTATHIELEKSFEMKIASISKRGEDLIITFDFTRDGNFKNYFEFFSKFAFPDLRLREEKYYSDLVNAFEQSGFLAKFASAEINKNMLIDEFKETWRKLDSDKNGKTFDFVAVDREKKVRGSSSLTNAFSDKTKNTWVLQQMSSVARPEYFELTHQLYVWRAHLLCALPETDYACCWVDSKSRWIERIWVKFVNYSKDPRLQFHPITIYVSRVEAKKMDKLDVRHNEIGSAKRVDATEDGKYLAAAGPKRLNASGLLNYVGGFGSNLKFQDGKKIAAGLTAELGLDQEVFRIGVVRDSGIPIPVELPEEGVSIHPLDRFCYFPVEISHYLLASIDHSLAVLRKKNAANFES